MKPLSNWKVNPQPSTGPSAGRFSPDPEQHHPELGTARQHAAQQAAEAAAQQQRLPGAESPLRSPAQIPAILIPHGTPSPAPHPDIHPQNANTVYVSQRSHHEAIQRDRIPPDRAYLPGGQPVREEGVQSPFNRAVQLNPLDRGQSNTGMEPHFAPLRPYSPSEAYLPGHNADPRVENLHRDMVGHNFATFMHHPQAAMAPAGQFVLERSIGDALLQFREQVRAMPDPYHEYAQTYRMVDGNRMEPVHPNLIQGYQNEVRLPEGSYPPGTGLVIHSHPPRRDGMQVPGRPSEADMLRAYHDRTNALQDPRSNVTSHILYDHGTDQAFIYDGRLGPDGNPRYYHAVVPQSFTPPVQPQAPAMPAPVPYQAPLPAPVAVRPPVQEGNLLRQTPSPVGSPNLGEGMGLLPADLANSLAAPIHNQHDASSGGRFPDPGPAYPSTQPSRPASAAGQHPPAAGTPRPGTPVWNDWVDFTGGRSPTPSTPKTPTQWNQWIDFDSPSPGRP